MVSDNPLGTYDEATLRALEKAVRDVWQVLTAHHPSRDSAKNADLKRELAFTVMALADCGVRDPQELCSRALANFDLKPLH